MEPPIEIGMTRLRPITKDLGREDGRLNRALKAFKAKKEPRAIRLRKTHAPREM